MKGDSSVVEKLQFPLPWTSIGLYKIPPLRRKENYFH
jgi:hypothetical protein